MINFLAYAVVLLGAFLLEGTIRHFPFVSVHVDIVIVVVFFIGFFVSLAPGAPLVILLGLIQEAVAVPFHGVLPVVYLAIFLFLRLTRNHLFFEGGLPQVLWIMILSFVAKIIELVLLVWQGYEPSFPFFSYALSSLLQGLLSLALFPFLSRQGKVAAPYGT